MMLPPNPILPAYRVGVRAAQIGFRCELCSGGHLHGLGDGHASQWRGSHCPQSKPDEMNRRLLIVGSVASPHMVPRCSAEDLERFNTALAPCEQFL